MQQPLTEYLERLKHYGYSEEELQAVKEFRETAEHLTYEQYKVLVEQQLVKRTRKIKKPRNIYFFEEKFWILNHRFKRYEYISELYSEEFLEERRLKKEEERRIVEENRARKKAEKQAKKTPIVEEKPVKPKRKRIGQ